jgi:hypothetical protein
MPTRYHLMTAPTSIALMASLLVPATGGITPEAGRFSADSTLERAVPGGRTIVIRAGRLFDGRSHRLLSDQAGMVRETASWSWTLRTG